MTESKPPTSSRIIRPGGIVTTPAALGHTYTPGSQFQLMTPRPKLNQATQSSSNVTNVPHTLITSTSSTQFQVSLPLGSSAKGPLTVSYMTKPNSDGPPTTRAYSGHALVEKLATSSETHIKASFKSVEIHKGNYGVLTTIAKPLPSVSPTRNIMQAPMRKDSEIGKVRPVLVGAGLRQPLKPHHQHQVTKTNLYGDPLTVISRGAPVHASSWVIHQQDNSKPPVSNTPLSTAARMKPPFLNTTPASPHDLSKKHSIPQQPKSTISITPHIPPSEAIHRSTALTVAPIPAGGKPIYQVLPPGFQTQVQRQSNMIKKIPTMIVTQPISLSNSANTTTGFISPSSAISSGQITVMTCGDGITYVPAPTPPNGTNSSSIPIAKVYPQQQPTSRISVASTSGRISVPIISSTNATAVKTPLIQVGPMKSTPTTSVVMTTQTTIMSSIPVTVSKTVTNAGLGSVLCWPNFSQPVSTVTSTTNLRPSLTLTGALTPQNLSVPGKIRVQPHNVVLVDHPKTAHLQASVGSAPTVVQVADTNRGNASHIAANQGSAGPTTPTMSPKPTILRRQRPDNSNAPKKLSFSATPQPFGTQRRDLHTKPLERRPAPYHLNRPKMANNTNDMKNEMPVVLHSGNSLGEKNEIKPVLENQVFGKQLGGGNALAPLKVLNSIKSQASQFSNSAKDGGTASYSIHPVIDLKVKMEAGYSISPQNSHPVKSEPASASQMLQFQSQSMHTYAAESPQKIPNVQHRVVTQASGQHITTNTIFTKPGSRLSYPVHQGSRPKPAQVIKSAPATITGPHSQSDTQMHESIHGVNSLSPHRTPTYPPDRILPGYDNIKKEQQARIKPAPGLESTKLVGENNFTHLPNHLAASPAKVWPVVNNADLLAGLSPRKRPRKQTHVVSEDQPVVMEDEESTDDADECEDEPMLEMAPQNLNISATPAAKLPGHKSMGGHRPMKIDSTNKRSAKEEKTSHIKSEHVSLAHCGETKPLSEYTDRNGVRYVVSRKRPSVSVLNRLKPNSRSIANHFMRYSDIKVKDKKTTLSDLANEKKRLKGIKVARLAAQLQDMVESEKDVWHRMQAVYEGLVEYKSTLAGDATFESNLASPSPGTPSSLSNSFRKATPRSSRSSSMSALNEIGPMQSPSTPLDRKAHKVKDEISNIEELAQANLQRCRVVTDQLADTKTMLLKSVDHRQLVTDILESSSNQKTHMHTSVNPNVMKRLPKKKNNS